LPSVPPCTQCGSASNISHAIGTVGPTYIAYSGSAALFGNTTTVPSSSSAVVEKATDVPPRCGGVGGGHGSPRATDGDRGGGPSPPTCHASVICVTRGCGHSVAGVATPTLIARPSAIGGPSVVVGASARPWRANA